jgi:exodeoxyribonuclease VII small subunit
VTDEPNRSPSSDGPDETPVSELTYAEASLELDEIVEFFEHRDVDVDQLVARLQRATALVDELDSRVRKTRSQVEQLVPRLQASARPAEDDSGSDPTLSAERDDDTLDADQ